MAILQATVGWAPFLIKSTARKLLPKTNIFNKRFQLDISIESHLFYQCTSYQFLFSVDANKTSLKNGNYLGRKRIMMSPSPVAAAPPAVLSAYAPAPATGESPTRLQISIHILN